MTGFWCILTACINRKWISNKIVKHIFSLYPFVLANVALNWKSFWQKTHFFKKLCERHFWVKFCLWFQSEFWKVVLGKCQKVCGVHSAGGYSSRKSFELVAVVADVLLFLCCCCYSRCVVVVPDVLSLCLCCCYTRPNTYLQMQSSLLTLMILKRMALF